MQVQNNLEQKNKPEPKFCKIRIEFEDGGYIKEFVVKRYASVGWKILFNAVEPLMEYSKANRKQEQE